jgi:Spy/CpxP family protein refolding chaperone
MNALVPILAAALALSAAPAAAQHGGHHQHGAHRPPPPAAADPARPYAGLEGRAIKSLSAEQIADLLAGRGMGLALAAELNGYPGPMHVLEHAEALRLTPAQRATAEALRDRMAGEARILGARIVGLERELDALFAGGAADAGRLAALTAEIGALNGRLREVHLATHIGMREALDATQRAAYARLRGYAAR